MPRSTKIVAAVAVVLAAACAALVAIVVTGGSGSEKAPAASKEHARSQPKARHTVDQAEHALGQARSPASSSDIFLVSSVYCIPLGDTDVFDCRVDYGSRSPSDVLPPDPEAYRVVFAAGGGDVPSYSRIGVMPEVAARKKELAARRAAPAEVPDVADSTPGADEQKQCGAIQDSHGRTFQVSGANLDCATIRQYAQNYASDESVPPGWDRNNCSASRLNCWNGDQNFVGQ